MIYAIKIFEKNDAAKLEVSRVISPVPANSLPVITETPGFYTIPTESLNLPSPYYCQLNLGAEGVHLIKFFMYRFHAIDENGNDSPIGKKDKDHPHGRNYGWSIKFQLVCFPSIGRPNDGQLEISPIIDESVTHYFPGLALELGINTNLSASANYENNKDKYEVWKRNH